MKELEDHGDICVLLRDGHQVEIVVLDEGERYTAVLYNGRNVALLLAIHHQRHKLVDNSHVQIASIISRYQHLPLQIQYVHHGRRHLEEKRLKLYKKSKQILNSDVNSKHYTRYRIFNSIHNNISSSL